MEVAHHSLRTEWGRLHYVTAGEGSPLLLVHGFPQTWHQWRPVKALLADRFSIVAPDLRGIGATPGPAAGYDKQAMADDLLAVTRAAFGDVPAMVVGHDMGSYVAFGYALKYPERASALMVIDAPVPGTDLFDQLIGHPRAWHVAFHQARDVAEMLVAGRERAYIAQFVAARIHAVEAIGDADLDVYARAYAAPGALRAAFEMYRALPQDAAFNRAALARAKLPMPVVAVGGGESLSGGLLDTMVGALADDARAVTVAGSGHWVPEEKPAELAALIEGLASAAAAR